MIQSSEAKMSFISQLLWNQRPREGAKKSSENEGNKREVSQRSAAKSPTPQQLLAATASHDMATPVSIVSNAAWALKKGCDEEEAKYWVEAILRNVMSLQILVDDFKELATEEVSPPTRTHEAVNLGQLAAEAVEDFKSFNNSHPIVFSGDDAWVLGHPEQLKRLIFNLLSNAAKYSQAGREIKVDVWRRGANICLFVQDNGKGITDADSERIFLPFVRLEQHSNLTPGRGLGLASVKLIADAHGAAIRVQGAPGQGTIFETCFKALDLEAISPSTNDAPQVAH